jgi:hypothetical protein
LKLTAGWPNVLEPTVGTQIEAAHIRLLSHHGESMRIEGGHPGVQAMRAEIDVLTQEPLQAPRRQRRQRGDRLLDLGHALDRQNTRAAVSPGLPQHPVHQRDRLRGEAETGRVQAQVVLAEGVLLIADVRNEWIAVRHIECRLHAGHAQRAGLERGQERLPQQHVEERARRRDCVPRGVLEGLAGELRGGSRRQPIQIGVGSVVLGQRGCFGQRFGRVAVNQGEHPLVKLVQEDQKREQWISWARDRGKIDGIEFAGPRLVQVVQPGLGRRGLRARKLQALVDEFIRHGFA